MRETRRPGRKIAAIVGTGALALSVMAGATFASYSDSEYGWFNGNGANGGETAAIWNMQIRNEGETVWNDTRQFGAKEVDNLADDGANPIKLSFKVNGLSNGEQGYENSGWVPGDSSTDLTGTVELRLGVPAGASGVVGKDSTLQVSIIDYSAFDTSNTKGKASSQDLLKALRVDLVDVNDNNTVYPGLKIGDVQTGLKNLEKGGDNKPTTGTVHKIQYRIYLPDQGTAAANAALQGAEVFLEFKADGQSV
jgi:hypothetical protein